MTGQATRIRWNSLFAFLSQAIRLLTNFILFVGIARFYGPLSFGQFTTAHTFSTILILFADFGFDTLLATEVARHRDRAREISRNYFSVKMVFASVATLALMVFPLFHPMDEPTRILLEIFSLNVLFTALGNFFFALFKGYEQFRHETRITLIINLFCLGLLLVAWWFHLSISMFAVIFILTRFLGFILAFRVASRLTETSFYHFDFSHWREVIKQVLVFGLLILFGNLCFQLDTIMLASMRGPYDVGVYQAVFKLAVLTLVIPDIATSSLLPVLSRLNRENAAQWKFVGNLLNKTLTFIALTISTILFIFADQIIHAIYGPQQYAESIPLLRIFACIILVRFSVETYGLMLTTSLRQKDRMLVVLVATVLNAVLNMYAIPTYGVSGAAVVSLITNLFIGCGYILATRSIFAGWGVNLKNILPVFIISLIAALLWNFRSWSVWYAAPITLICCSAVIYLLGYSREERALVFAFKKTLPVGGP